MKAKLQFRKDELKRGRGIGKSALAKCCSQDFVLAKCLNL